MALKELEKSVSELAEQFALSLKFKNVEVMSSTIRTMKIMHIEQNCLECTSSKICASQDLFADYGKCTNDVSADYNNDDNTVSYESYSSKVNRGVRKSRQSVCIIPRIMSSSDSSDGEEEEHDVQEIQDAAVASDDDIKVRNLHESFNLHAKKMASVNTLIVVSSDDETESDTASDIDQKDIASKHRIIEERDSDSSIEEQVPFKHTKKKILYDSSDEELKGHVDDDVNQSRVGAIMTSSETAVNDVYIVESDEQQSSTEKNENKVNKVVTESSEEENFEDYIGSFKQNTVAVTGYDEESNNSLSEFIVEEEAPKSLMKTPKPLRKPIFSDKKLVSLATPSTASKNIFSHIQTPKSVPGTPAHKREFRKICNVVLKELFELFNSTIFDNKLPSNFQITWNKRMTKTAGFCYYSTSLNIRESRIELSDKVIDCVERIRDTLIHELCHAATWIIDGQKAGHGPAWKYWAKKANKIHPDLPVIGRCHQYEIHTKYNYKCSGCGQTFGRHSKSIDASRHRCAQCGGIPKLIPSSSTTGATPKTPNAYALFMKENFASVKKINPGVSHKEIMQKISERFKSFKLAEGNNESRIDSF